MSGLSQLSPVRGPPDVKLARPVPFGLGIVVLPSVTVPPAPCGESAPTRFSGSVVSPAHGALRKATANPEERDRDGEELARVRILGDLSLKWREPSRVGIHHRYRCSACLLTKDRPRDSRTRPAQGHDVSLPLTPTPPWVTRVLGRVAAKGHRTIRVAGPQHRYRESTVPLANVAPLALMAVMEPSVEIAI